MISHISLVECFTNKLLFKFKIGSAKEIQNNCNEITFITKTKMYRYLC